MDKFENDVLDSFKEKTGLRPLVWFRYIDDIFFVLYGHTGKIR